MSCYPFFCLIFFRNFDMYLLFILWKSVENNQQLLCLALSWFFPLTLILSTLLNFLYTCYLRLESQNYRLTVDLHTASNCCGGDDNWWDGLCSGGQVFFPLHLQEYLVHPYFIKGKVYSNALYNYFLCTLAQFLYNY